MEGSILFECTLVFAASFWESKGTTVLGGPVIRGQTQIGAADVILFAAKESTC